MNWGITKHKNCHLYRINGVGGHVHIVSDLHPAIALADFIKDIKIASSKWMKESGQFPLFSGCQKGYGAFTYSIEDRDNLINYVKNRKEHHKKETFADEFKRIFREHEIDFDEKYLL